MNELIKPGVVNIPTKLPDGRRQHDDDDNEMMKKSYAKEIGLVPFTRISNYGQVRM